MDIIDLRETRDQALLEQVYNELFLTCFTDPNEQEDLEQYRSRLFDAQLPPPQPITRFFVAGENLDNPSRRQVFGMMISELYRESSCGLLTYLAVAPDMRDRGVGRALVEQAIEVLAEDSIPTGGLRAVFAEIRDPARSDSTEESMPPGDRVTVMCNLGAQWVPVRYVQPALRPRDQRSPNLMLIAFPAAPAAPVDLVDRVLVAFLDEFYRALGIAKPADNADFLATRDDIQAAVKGNVRPGHRVPDA